MELETDPPIVGIGASAGGVKALQAFFEALPDEPNAAFVVVIHLNPERRSELATILATRTRMPVSQVSDQVHLRNNHVYVIAPDSALNIADHMISALPFDEPRAKRAPIDLFFRSLAAQHSDGFAIILTGAGADGAAGVRAIKEVGGIVLVQDPDEAEFASMPRNAIATDAADFVLPVRDLARQLADLLRKRRDGVPLAPPADDDDIMRRILAHVRVRLGHDFSQYKRATIARRVTRRMQVTQHDTLADYYTHLREHANEVHALFADFLISVTTFFRDKRAFEQLETLVIPQLFEGKEAAHSIRIWVPACATGEEAYSIAMLLLEEAARRDVRPEIQVFGSDLDTDALVVAREGCFPVAIDQDIAEERLRRFFQREGEHYRVRRELRDVVMFASHSVLRDPPFARVDLVSCRNLLIYLDRELQHQVYTTFHYALNTGGFLFLGASESADNPPGLFRAIDRDARIYRMVPNTGERRTALPIMPSTHQAAPSRGAPAHRSAGAGGAVALHRQMLERVAPPSMLVDETHRAIHLSETAGRFLQPSGGPVTTVATDMVRPELRFDLEAALHRAFDRGETTLSRPLAVRFDGQPQRVYVQVKPVLEEGDPGRYALVLFIEGEAVRANGDTGVDDDLAREPNDETVRRLQEELQMAQSRLRATREEAEATNEELRAANEELQSINEEYRSTSEELETSKEELQSTNEELQTVNNELKQKLASVSRAHSDLQNLMAAADFGTLFLDPALRIKRFTPRVTELFNITATDAGRPITDFTHQLDYDQLADHAHAVLRELTLLEHEVKSRGGDWYLVRIRPYRTVDDRIDGVVVTFVDITERRRVEGALRDSDARLKQEMRLVEFSRAPIFVWEYDHGIVQWNRGSEDLYGYSREEAKGRDVADLLRSTPVEGSFDIVRRALSEKGAWSGELRHTTKDGRVLTVESQIEMIEVGGRRLVLESTRDVTDQKKWEQRRQLLLGELRHRVGNTLAVVQSLARQTLRTAGSNERFVDLFEGRLTALARAHALLVDCQWEGAELMALARIQLAAYISADPQRLRLEGENVLLPPHLATPFGLVLHELATNAAKYGAFSVACGRVVLSWARQDREGAPLLTVTWQEFDGPPVVPPEHHGFGGVLIERGLPGAAVTRRFEPGGLICTMDIDLEEEERDGDDD
ncbi:chemotaxis protein CheB [Nitrospirillum pindoramense]|uniref:Two-component system CheB/CheR fusion protein n=1 Tax=Nitrospirillum amazonense TaxID=28077 RepID=A0A560GZU2_9PROT|nr:chemotaxis protein CheB [Nitrospirillum amazonense]TWB39069.1 two-component system CheB/CheR fusion protein [Nitrospirillum amazonense]